MSTITLSEGKYVVREKPNGSLEALRHGEPWRDLTGDGLVFSMFHRLLELSWIPVTERLPTGEDANEYGDVDWSNGKEIWEAHYTEPREATHWKRIVLP